MVARHMRCGNEIGPKELTSLLELLDSASPSPRTKETDVAYGKMAATVLEEDATETLSSADVIEADGKGIDT